MIARTLGVVLAVGATVAVAALSRITYDADANEEAVLRLAWRARGDRLEQCRALTEEEMAALPAHMRRPQVCTGQVLPYTLVAVVNGDTLVRAAVHSAGARADRPLYVDHDLPLAPGTYDVAVQFARQGDLPDSIQPLTPGLLEFEGRLTLRARQIGLVTYDPDRRALVLRGYGRP